MVCQKASERLRCVLETKTSWDVVMGLLSSSWHLQRCKRIPVLPLFSSLATALAACGIAKAVQDSLFLKQFKARSLPRAYVGIATLLGCIFPMTRYPLLAGVILAAGTLTVPEATASQTAIPSPKGIPRFYKVVEGIYRGGQPTTEGFQALQKMGIKTVINLQEANDEQPTVEKLGMNCVHIPLNAWHGVPDDAIETFFRIVTDRTKHPVFVHCRRGADRTGVMVAFYRIAFGGWSAGKAYQEARTLGMRWWHRGLKRQLFEFARKQAKNRPSPSAAEEPSQAQ